MNDGRLKELHMPLGNDTIYIGVGGHVVAIERSTGAEQWRCRLCSSTIVTLVVEGDSIYAGAKGELFCVDRSTGVIRWRNRLRRLGMSVVVFGGSPAATLVAETSAQAATTSGVTS